MDGCRVALMLTRHFFKKTKKNRRIIGGFFMG
jgi:hypothetical protein